MMKDKNEITKGESKKSDGYKVTKNVRKSKWQPLLVDVNY